jgi:hypothetical protein
MMYPRFRRLSEDVPIEHGRGSDAYGMSERRAYGVALESRLGQAYNQEAFRYFLDIERKRAARAQRPVVLLLLDARRVPINGSPIDPLLAAKLFSGLWLCLRETDVVGWFREERISGAVLTQLDSSPGPNVSQAIRSRVSGAIGNVLPPEVARSLRVRVYQLHPRPERLTS